MADYNFSDMFQAEPALKPLTELITEIMSFPEESLTDDNVEIITNIIISSLNDQVKNESVKGVMQGFEDAQLSKNAAQSAINTTKTEINNYIEGLQPSKLKKQIIQKVFDLFYDIFDTALEQYHNYSIELPIKLEEGAQMPTYAHDTDACADLYAANDITLPANSYSNMVRTGVHIALPEGWMAMIFPRSSIGAKTQNRLSNSVGIIDSEYRGPLGVLYDNLSDSNYEIKAGDRVAQMLVMPSYRFKGVQVDTLPESDRGEGGFGSTGK